LLIRGKKCSSHGIPCVSEEPIPRFGTEWKGTKFCKKMFLKVIHVFFFVLGWLGTSFQGFFLPFNGSERNSECFVFCEIIQKGIPSIFIFRGLFRNEITKFRVFFSSTKWFLTEFRAFLSSAKWFGMKLRGSEYFSLLQNSSERNSELFYVSFTEWLGTEF
jgi:hypothetical protein